MQVAYKLLRAVETANVRTGNHQCELNGVSRLKAMFGTERRELRLRVALLSDEPETEESDATWYDSRANQPNRSPEYRLYFSSRLLAKAEPGWLFALAGEVAMIADPTYAPWLVRAFGLSDLSETFRLADTQLEMPAQVRLVLSQAGLELPESDDGRILEVLVERFGGNFPTTAAFSAFARESCQAVSNTPDEKLVNWMDHEWRLYRVFERRELATRLRGITDPNEVIRTATSMRNRRFSRAGHAFENHIAHILESEHVTFAHGEITELRKRPDFVFPSIAAYRNFGFPAELLTMLGAKTSLKDRWRQILSEADRVPRKHLITLQPRLSAAQAEEVDAAGVAVVSPMGMPGATTFSEFVEMVKERQAAAQSL